MAEDETARLDLAQPHYGRRKLTFECSKCSCRYQKELVWQQAQKILSNPKSCIPGSSAAHGPQPVPLSANDGNNNIGEIFLKKWNTMGGEKKKKVFPPS